MVAVEGRSWTSQTVHAPRSTSIVVEAPAAVGLALLLPSEHAAASGDLVLAVLVVLTALGIDPRELWALHSRWKAVLALSLGAVRAARSARLGDQPPVRQPAPRGRAHPRTLLDGGRGGRPGRTGRWGCCARARALAGSLVAAATVGPIVVGLLAADAAAADLAGLLGRFALVPLAAGVAARVVWPRLTRGELWFAAGSTVAVAVLIYASLSGTEAGEDLSPALAASAVFLALFAVPALAWARLVSDDQRPRGGVRCRTTRLRRRRHARHTGIRSSRRHVGGTTRADTDRRRARHCRATAPHQARNNASRTARARRLRNTLEDLLSCRVAHRMKRSGRRGPER